MCGLEPKGFNARGGDRLESESQNLESRFATTPLDEDESDDFVLDLLFALSFGEGELDSKLQPPSWWWWWWWLSARESLSELLRFVFSVRCFLQGPVLCLSPSSREATRLPTPPPWSGWGKYCSVSVR